MAEIPARDAFGTSAQPLTVGDDIRLKTVDTTEWLHGKYKGDREHALVLGKRAGDRVIPYDQITALEIERGSYLGEGLAVGIIVDAIAVGIVAGALSERFNPGIGRP